jgi:hypothetical protein
MKCLDETKLVPGDIVLSTEDHYLSKAIRAVTKSDISHAMIYVASCSIIDSTDEGVHARNTRRLFFDDNCAVHVRRLTPGLGDEQRELVINYARSRIGTRYSKLEAVRASVGTTKTPSRQQFCSRLVAQAYAWAGIPLVDSPDYCTPDDIKNSKSLGVVPDAVMSVSSELVAHVEDDFDTNDVMREVTNKLLDAARKRNPSIECFDDIDEHLVTNPADDECFAKFYEDSGYLTAWELEFNKNRWQYEFPLFASAPGSQTYKRSYCAGVIEGHGDMLVRREGSRAGYTILHCENGLQTFAKLKTLYEKLVDLQFARRTVALQWLQQFAPDALPGPANADSLTAHSEGWFAVLSRQNPHQAQMTRKFMEFGESREVCTFCGDSPARDHRYIGDKVQPATVLTCKLCDDCPSIRKMQFDEEYSPL